mgnify:CR=1 FL=1
MAKLLFQGHASCRITTHSGTVIYIDPFAGEGYDLPADLVLISVGFLHPDTETILDQLPVELDKRGNIARNDKFATSQDGVFVCGDAGRGQSLVVWAIAEGRSCAAAVDEYLSKEKSELPAPIKASQRPMMLPR